MERLIGAILLQTIKDWQDDTNRRPEIQEFLQSPWFAVLADGLQIDPGSIRVQLESESYQQLSLRSAYR